MRVTFYHQVRTDGGRRTGLSINDSRGIENFVDCPDPEEFDPALRWYIDVSWEVPEPPRTQREARVWYAQHLAELRGVLEAVAETLRAGIDGDLVPWVLDLPGPTGNVRVTMSAQRRYDGAHVAQGIRAALASDVDGLAREESLACAAG